MPSKDYPHNLGHCNSNGNDVQALYTTYMQHDDLHAMQQIGHIAYLVWGN
jgi:hypothetical protein